jgi:hypothetical protein
MIGAQRETAPAYFRLSLTLFIVQTAVTCLVHAVSELPVVGRPEQLTLIFALTNCMKPLRKELPRIDAPESSCLEIGSHIPTSLMLVYVRQGGGKGRAMQEGGRGLRGDEGRGGRG